MLFGWDPSTDDEVVAFAWCGSRSGHGSLDQGFQDVVHMPCVSVGECASLFVMARLAHPRTHAPCPYCHMPIQSPTEACSCAHLCCVTSAALGVGRGGFGHVFLAYSLHNNGKLAVKVVSSTNSHHLVNVHKGERRGGPL